MSDGMQDRLADYCARAFSTRQELRIHDLARISTGWESDIYSFALESGPAGARQREELILRIYPAQDAHEKSAREFHGMELLREAGYPVPRVLALEREDSPFSQPFLIMERVRGRQMWPAWFGSPEEEQQEHLTLFCELFVRLHRLPYRPFVEATRSLEARDPYTYVDRQIERTQPYLERVPLAGFVPVFEWLEARRDQVPCTRPSVVHWDFHPANILLDQDGSAVVIDWTQIDVSDPRFDLAWTLLLVSTYEGEAWRGRILREYERLAGASVEQLAFFDVYACLKRLYSLVASLTFGPEAVGMRPDAAAIMRRQMDATGRVYALLLQRTGIRVPELERLLIESSGA